MNWKIIRGFIRLVENNSGVSSKNFFLVLVTLIGCLMLLVPIVVLIFEVFYNHTITTDLNGMAAYVASVASLFATAGLTKAWSEKFEGNDKINNNHEIGED